MSINDYARRLKFGPFELRGRQLRRDGKPVRLPPKETAVLLALADARGLPVARLDLMRAGWGDTAVSEASLTRCIHALRRHLATPDGHEVIETLHRQGFRLNLPVRSADERAGGDAAAASGTRDPRALDLYLQAREFQGRRTAGNLRLAVESLRRAVAVDAGYLAAWLALARLHITCCLRGLARGPTAHADAALEAAEQALALAPDHHCAQALTAWVRTVVYRDESAAASFDTRGRSAPLVWEWRFCRAWTTASLGDFDTALADLDVAATLNPMRTGGVYANGYLRFCAGDVDAALAYLRRATEDLPSADGGWHARAIVASWCGHHEEAIAAGRRAADIAEGLPMVASALAYALARADRQGEARALLVEFARRDDAHLPASQEAAVHIALGDTASACEALERARASGCPYRQLVRFDPRFEAFLANCGGGQAARPPRPAC